MLADDAATSSAQAVAVRAATEAEIAGWDGPAVHAPGGHVLQSRAWAGWRTSLGRRQAHYYVFADGGRALAMVRAWPAIGGGSAYVARGPRQGDAAPADGAAVGRRLAALATALRSDGVDVLAVDPEVPEEDAAYARGLADAGFRPIEELQPSRHRMRVVLGPHVDEAAAFGAISRSTRQRITAAERDLAVVRHDGLAGEPGSVDRFVQPDEPPGAAFERFGGMLAAAGERLGFPFAMSELDWWRRAFDDGLLVLLEARVGAPGGEPVAGLALYRHGGILSTAHSADRVETRRSHPGALHLLRWRALQLAVAAGAPELDLGGVDVAGARREPQPGEPTYGLFEHKRAFGAEWVAQSGAQERVLRPWRYAAGRSLARLARPTRARSGGG
jgi:hypothetical protein